MRIVPAPSIRAASSSDGSMRAHAGQVEQHVVAEVRPHDDEEDQRNRRPRAPEPLALQAVEPDPAENLVQRPVELQHRRGEDADHDRRVHRRQEDGGAEDPPARHAPVDRERHDQRHDDQDRHREREDRVVPQGVPEDRVAPEELEVVEADPLGGADAVPAREGVVEDARERIGDEDADERNRRAPRRAGPTATGGDGACSVQPMSCDAIRGSAT